MQQRGLSDKLDNSRMGRSSPGPKLANLSAEFMKVREFLARTLDAFEETARKELNPSFVFEDWP
jgi:hypothetical protein